MHIDTASKASYFPLEIGRCDYRDKKRLTKKNAAKNNSQ